MRGFLMAVAQASHENPAMARYMLKCLGNRKCELGCGCEKSSNNGKSHHLRKHKDRLPFRSRADQTRRWKGTRHVTTEVTFNSIRTMWMRPRTKEMVHMQGAWKKISLKGTAELVNHCIQRKSTAVPISENPSKIPLKVLRASEKATRLR